MRRFTTWTPPEELAPTKARKAAERAADAWEQEAKAEYKKDQQAKAEGRTLQNISPIDIQKYLVYLRTKCQGRFGRSLTPKTVHRQYSTLNLIFSCAKEKEMMAKNPMDKVEAPKNKPDSGPSFLRAFPWLKDA